MYICFLKYLLSYSCTGSHRSMARSGCGTFGSSQNVNSEHNGTSHHRHCIELVEFGSFPLDSRQEFAHIYRWLCRMHHGYLRCTSRHRRKFSKWCLKKFFKKHYFLVLKKIDFMLESALTFDEF